MIDRVSDEVRCGVCVMVIGAAAPRCDYVQHTSAFPLERWGLTWFQWVAQNFMLYTFLDLFFHKYKLAGELCPFQPFIYFPVGKKFSHGRNM